jgi:hypothetical protein
MTRHEPGDILMKSLTTFLAAFVTVPSSLAATYVVDANGGGSFTAIHTAITAAQAGDVLIVKDGNYPFFTLDKDLAILGAAGEEPLVIGLTTIATDDATIAGLTFGGSLHVRDAAGTISLDDVRILGSGSGVASCSSFLIEDCALVHVQRSTIQGKDGDIWCESPGLVVRDSNVTLGNCVVAGGDGWAEEFVGYDGQPGILVLGSSTATIVDTDSTGGSGGQHTILGEFAPDGSGAAAIVVASPARAIVRGNADDHLQGGFAGGPIFGTDAPYSIAGDGRLTFSGVSHSPAALSPALDLTLPSPPQAFERLVGEDHPSSFKRLSVFGPPGASVLVFFSLSPASFLAPGVEGRIYFDPSTAVALPLTTISQDVAVNVTFTLPASLVGLEGATLHVQGIGAGLGTGGNWLALNPAHLVIRGM